MFHNMQTNTAAFLGENSHLQAYANDFLLIVTEDIGRDAHDRANKAVEKLIYGAKDIC